MTNEWTEVAKEDEIPNNSGIKKEVEGEEVALYNMEGEIYAFDAICPHQEGPLEDGILVEENVIACPWHGWEFDIRTGDSVSHNASIKTFDVKVEDGTVYIKGSGSSCGEGCCCKGDKNE